MSLLIVNTTESHSFEVNEAITALTSEVDDFKIVHTSEMNIQSCNGCYVCMLNTPGVCCIKDDYHEIFNMYLQYDHVVFVVDTSFGFLNSRAKNVIDRMFPLVSVLICYQKGSVRHVPRYDKNFHLSLLYTGDGNDKLINHWMDRFADNLHALNCGAFHLSKVKELKKCM